MSFRAECEKKWVKCVEELLEQDITEEQLLKSAEILSVSQYGDVVEERNIEGLCGYPLCNASLGPTPKQKYHISVAKKQILDLTERKKFCSDACYKCSEYFSAQLSPLPLWLRTDTRKVKFRLLSSKKDASVPSNLGITSRVPSSGFPRTITSRSPKAAAEPLDRPPLFSHLPKVEAIKEKTSEPVPSPPTPPSSATTTPTSTTTITNSCGSLSIEEKHWKPVPIHSSLAPTGGNSFTPKMTPPKVSQVSKLLSAISTWISVPQGDLWSHDRETHQETRSKQNQVSCDLEPDREDLESHNHEELSSEGCVASPPEKSSKEPGVKHLSQNADHALHEREHEEVFLPPVDSVNISRIQHSLFNTQLHRHLSTVCSALDLSLPKVLPQVKKTTSKFRSCEDAVEIHSKSQVKQWLQEIKATPDDFKLMLATFR